jgi:hypothetical protein
MGGTITLSWANLAAAFSANGTAGTQYSTALTVANPDIQVIAISRPW